MHTHSQMYYVNTECLFTSRSSIEPQAVRVKNYLYQTHSLQKL